MLYRVRQFAKALFPNVTAEEIRWVKQKVSPPAQDLFFKQDSGEQRHALDVATLLFQDLVNLPSSAESQDLLTAALLHDCGKSLVQVRIWHRVFIVLVHSLPSPWRSRIESNQSLLSLPLRISSRHARWGELLARRAGLNSQVCRLIAEHHQPTTELGQMLRKADDQC